MSLKTKKGLSLLTISIIAILPMIAFGQYDSNLGQGDSGLSNKSIYSIVNAVMNWLLLILTIIAVIGFIISGLLFIIAGGDSGRRDEAKGWLQWSIVGIIVALIGYIVIELVDTLLRGNVQGGL